MKQSRAMAIGLAVLGCGGVLSDRAFGQSAGNRVQGLDVSDWQGTITWSSVYGAGKRFTIIRASRGGTTGTYNENTRVGTLSQRYDDLTFFTNIKNATSAGLFAGTYHFARPDIVTDWPTAGQVANDPVDEANHFLEQAGPWMKPGYLLPVLDLESGQPNDPAGTPGRTSSQLSSFAVSFANRIATVTGVKPLCYINQNYANYVNSTVITMPLWMARWNGQGTPGYDYTQVDWNNGDPEPSPSTANVYGRWNPSFPTIPNPEPWQFWQYTSQGRCAGIGGGTANVDLDVAHGSIEYLKDYLVPALWTRGSSEDWSAVANWNSDNPGYVAGDNTSGPAPRLPGTNDTVVLNNALSAGSYAVTHSSGNDTIRKLYVQQPLNLTGGSLTIGYVPSADSTPYSAKFSQPVSLAGAALSVHTLLVDAAQTFTFSGGTLTLNKLTLSPAASNAATLAVAGNISVNPLNNATATITSAPAAGQVAGNVDLGGGTRTITVGDGSAATDLLVDVPLANGAITKAGPGTMKLNKSATFNAPVTVSRGILQLTANDQLGTAAVTQMTVTTAGSGGAGYGGTIQLTNSISYGIPLTIGGAGNNGILGSGGTPSTPGGIGALDSASGSNTWSGAITLAGTGVNGTDPLINQVSAASGSSLTLSGVITSGPSGALAKAGAGDLVLSGLSPNTYDAFTRLYGGRIILEKDAALGSAANHTYMLAGSSTTIAFRAPASSPAGYTYATQEYLFTEGVGASGLGQVDNLAGDNTFAGSIGIAGPGNVGSIGVSAGSLTITGGIYARSTVSTRTVNKLGPGTLVLAGDSSIAPTSISALQLTASTLNVNAGTVDLRGPRPDAANVPSITTYTVAASATLLNSFGTLSGVSISVGPMGTFRQFDGRMQNVTLSIAAGAVAQLNPSPSSPSVLSGLTLSPGGQVDLTSNDLVIDYASSSPIDTIRQALQTGRGGGSSPWTGPGIISSSAQSPADPQARSAIGYAEAGQVLALPAGQTASWSGVTVDASAVLLKYTWYGDLNLDGAVNADDYALLDRSLARGGLAGSARWADGDVNYDGVVDSSDYLLTDRSAALQSGVLSPALLATREAQFGPAYVSALLSSVPEPAGFGLAPLLILAGSIRRRIRR